MDIVWKWNIVRFLFTTVYLMAGWLLFTWSLAPFSLLVGALSSALIALFTFRFFINETEAGRRSLVPRLHYLAVYLAYVIFRMYTTSFKTLYLIARNKINPRIVHFRTRLSSDTARVTLTNSINLRADTITVDLSDDHLIVHWLDAKTRHSRHAGELIKGRFERLLEKIWM
jgi:multicomponent Na+:H+ antiporter subunit E